MGIPDGKEGRGGGKEQEKRPQSSLASRLTLRATVYTAGSPHSQESRLQMLKFLNRHNPEDLIF